jgi:deoxyhypusine synthase
MREVRDMELRRDMQIVQLLEQMGSAGGFNASLLYEAYQILLEMISKKECLRFLSFTGNLVSTGLRGVLRELAKRKLFDVFVTTCGSLDHDLARSFRPYYHGSFFADDAELRKKGINRLGNIFVPNESYGLIIEEKMQEFLKEMYTKGIREFSSYEFCRELGRWIGKEDSILYWCQKNGIPVIVPGLTDGAVGYQLWLFSQEHPDFKLNPLKDEQLMNQLIWEAKSCGALVIGGGISKHHVIWWAQFRGGLDYAVYLTTASEYDGSLSGARTREAVSWGKVKPGARHVTVEGDATITLPLLVCAILNKGDY